MIHRLIIIIFSLLLLFLVFEKQAQGQEYPWALQYVTNMHTINPAYVGMWDQAGVFVSTRTNWVGFSKNP